MKGLELAKSFYLEYGKPMIENEFGAYKERIAVGLVGHGSECFGYDDENSTDHDFDAGFNIWLTEEDEKEFGFKLFRAYSKLPKEYKGVKIQAQSGFGSENKGVHTIKDFYSFYLPNGEIPKSNEAWLSIPDFYLAEATNGEVFTDPKGEFTKIRNAILNDRPDDVWNKKLSSAVFSMAQAGQYNYDRCFKHGEKLSASMALCEFVKNTADAVFLLNRKYAPYYKWTYKAMKGLNELSEISNDLEKLMDSPYNYKQNVETIERICKKIGDSIRCKGLSDREDEYLEGYAYCINNKIKDGNLRNSSIIL